MYRSSLTLYRHMMPVVFILLVAFALRIADLDRLPPGISNDEAVDIIDAFHIARSGTFPLYEDFGRLEDVGRPEPLFRIIQTIFGYLFGESVWAYRFVSVLTALFSIAAAYQAARQCLYGFPGQTIGALAAMSALAVSLSHIVLSRSPYRAIIQPLFTFMFVAYLLVGLRTGRKKLLIASALSLAAALYTYTAALVLPAVLTAAGLWTLLWRRREFPRVVLVAVVAGIIMLPVALRFLDRPEMVLGRAGDVRGNLSVSTLINELHVHYFERGDVNPQYNAADAPLVTPIFAILMMLGIIWILFHFRSTSSAIMLTLLLTSPLPVAASNEFVHGLRIMGAFSAFPLLVSAAIPLIFRLTPVRVHCLQQAILTLLAILLNAGSAFYEYRRYIAYWQQPSEWEIYDRKLDYGEWFFRSDRRDLAEWITAQSTPLLIPADDLLLPSFRVWLMGRFKTVRTAQKSKYQLPHNTQLLIPWVLERQTLNTQARQYVLLDQSTMTLLPPLAENVHSTLISDIDAGTPITRNGAINLLGRIKTLPRAIMLEFQPVRQKTAINLEHEITIEGWRGVDTLPASEQEQEVEFAVDLSAQRKLGHDYSTFIRLADQNYNVISGQDFRLWRWLYPTTMWQPGETVTSLLRLKIPANLPPGAYRLLAGVYNFTDVPLLPIDANRQVVNQRPTVGWIKVPQPEHLTIPSEATPLDIVFEDTIQLKAAQLNVQSLTAPLPESLQIGLYWESLQSRPSVDATIFIHVLNASGQIVAQQDLRPEIYPTFIWDQGEIVRTEYSIPLPSGAEVSTIVVGMYSTDNQQRFTAVQDGKQIEDGRATLLIK